MLCAEKPYPHALVIAHRGASGERPEHTLASYRRAIAQGSHFIEVDLVLTRDGVLVARHENEISKTTNVAQHTAFAGRYTKKTINGRIVTGWFTEDFTLAELKRLRVRERLSALRSRQFDGRFTIATFKEILILLAAVNAKRDTPVGIAPETKYPSYFASIGLPHEAPLLALLGRYGYRTRNAPILIQSFETGNLKALRTKSDVPLIQLLPAHTQASNQSEISHYLRTIAAYADAIAPDKALIIPRTPDGSLSKPTHLVAAAHAAGLKVYPWTFRRENEFLPLPFRCGNDPAGYGNLASEIRTFLTTGIDGLFCDNPAQAIAAVSAPHHTAKL